MLNNKKENKRLPMPGKVKKGFRCYCTLVMAAAPLGCVIPLLFLSPR